MWRLKIRKDSSISYEYPQPKKYYLPEFSLNCLKKAVFLTIQLKTIVKIHEKYFYKELTSYTVFLKILAASAEKLFFRMNQ